MSTLAAASSPTGHTSAVDEIERSLMQAMESDGGSIVAPPSVCVMTENRTSGTPTLHMFRAALTKARSSLR